MSDSNSASDGGAAKALAEQVALREKAERFYEAAMNYFSLEEWRLFEESEEFAMAERFCEESASV